MTLLDVLKSVKTELGKITVSGEENLDRLLGSIRAVGNCISALSEQPKTEEEEKHADPENE